MKLGDKLSPREGNVLALICQGKANKIIAHDLGIAEPTVKVLVRQIMVKSGATNRTQLVCRELQARIDAAEETLERIKNWCEAYPLDIFPEPDLANAHKILTENGMTLDAISAHAMRHVVTSIKKLIEETKP